MKRANLRSTRYRRVPQQTQSMGVQNVCFDIATMFEQSIRIITADGLSLLINGTSGTSDRIESLIRKAGLTDSDICKIPQLGKALPSLPKLDFGQLGAIADALTDFANDSGSWRKHYESVVPSLIDQKVAELQPCLSILEDQLLRHADFSTTLQVLSVMAKRWLRESEQPVASKWQPSFAERLRQDADLYRRFAIELKQKSKWKVLRPSISKEDREMLEQHFHRALKMLDCRVQQLRLETYQRIKQLLADGDQPECLTRRHHDLTQRCERLKELLRHLLDLNVPLVDTVTETHVVHTTDQKMSENGTTVHDLIRGALEVHECSAKDVAAQLRRGVMVRGASLGPLELSALEERQALALLQEFAKEFFSPAIDSVLKIDLNERSLQLPLSQALSVACRKASPYLCFPHIPGVSPISEVYLHCHPDMLPTVERLRPSVIQFSNSPDDADFHLPERHVITISTNDLSAGHARKEYAAARYIRDTLVGKGEFASIYPFDQSLACPLYLEHRPDDEQDCDEVFNLGCEFSKLTRSAKSDGEPRYFVATMDESIRFCFERRVVSRISGDAEYFAKLLDQAWFGDFVSATIESLSDDWRSELLLIKDRQSYAAVADKMTALGILTKDKDSARFRFSRSATPAMQQPPAIYRSEHRMGAGLIRDDFISKLLNVDELYTRLVEDLISGEAAGQIPYRRLTPFIRHLIDERRRAGEPR